MPPPLKTVNVLIVAAAVLLGFTVLVVAIWIGSTQGSQEETKQVRACVAAGDQWVRGDCVHTHP